MEEVKCSICGHLINEKLAVFDYTNTATCMECELEQEEYDEYSGEEE